MVSVVALFLSIILCIPQLGICEELINADDIVNEVVGSFDKFNDPLVDGKIFLTSFLKEINSRYNLNLTIHEACQVVQKNLHTLNVSKEIEQVILDTIELYELKHATSQQHQKLQNSLMIATGVNWPWIWNWFGLNKQSHSPKPLPCETEELPSDIYIGAVELLAGALCCIVGVVYKPFYVAGSYLIGDGTNRILGGVSQVGEERRNNPNYIQPNFPES
jgi:hypothetical protein